MGLTYREAKSLGLGELHPAASGVSEAEALRRVGVALVAATTPKEPRPRGPTKLEASFMEVLDAAMLNRFIAHWRYEAVKLRLAGRTFYTPDFLAEPRWDDDRFTFLETKGPYAREDSLVKLKVAAEMYPCFDWLLVRREGRHSWVVHEVTRTGIGRNPIQIPWITGGGG